MFLTATWAPKTRVRYAGIVLIAASSFGDPGCRGKGHGAIIHDGLSIFVQLTRELNCLALS